MAEYFKYALVLRPSDGDILIKGSVVEGASTYEKESKKIVKKLIDADLAPDERKKIVSPKNGKWLAECDDQNIVHVCLISEDYPERLGYLFLSEVRKSIVEVNSYYKESPGNIKKAYEAKFMQFVEKFNKPESFDKLSSANIKVEKAQDKMKDNLQAALENQQDLEVIFI
jgi:DNA-binding NtrC family response regulator